MKNEERTEVERRATAVREKYFQSMLERQQKQMPPLLRWLLMRDLNCLASEESTVDAEIQKIGRRLWLIRFRNKALYKGFEVYERWNRRHQALDLWREQLKRRLHTQFPEILRSSHYTLDVKIAASWLEWSFPKLKGLLIVSYIFLGLYFVTPSDYTRLLNIVVTVLYCVMLFYALLTIPSAIWLFTKIDS